MYGIHLLLTHIAQLRSWLLLLKCYLVVSLIKFQQRFTWLNRQLKSSDCFQQNFTWRIFWGLDVMQVMIIWRLRKFMRGLKVWCRYMTDYNNLRLQRSLNSIGKILSKFLFTWLFVSRLEETVISLCVVNTFSWAVLV